MKLIRNLFFLHLFQIQRVIWEQYNCESQVYLSGTPVSSWAEIPSGLFYIPHLEFLLFLWSMFTQSGSFYCRMQTSAPNSLKLSNISENIAIEVWSYGPLPESPGSKDGLFIHCVAWDRFPGIIPDILISLTVPQINNNSKPSFLHCYFKSHLLFFFKFSASQHTFFWLQADIIPVH